MDTSNIVALILGGVGFIISLIGFILTPVLNLRSKKLEKRLEYRFMLFQKILELWESTHESQDSNQNVFGPLMKEVNKNVQIYGYNSEIESFKKVVSSYNNLAIEQSETSRQKFEENLNYFLSISFNAYRKELVLDKLVKTKNR